MVPIDDSFGASTLRLGWTMSFQDLCSLGLGIMAFFLARIRDESAEIGAPDANEPSRAARPKAAALDPSPKGALPDLSDLRRLGHAQELIRCVGGPSEPFEKVVEHVDEGTKLLAHEGPKELVEARPLSRVGCLWRGRVDAPQDRRRAGGVAHYAVSRRNVSSQKPAFLGVTRDHAALPTRDVRRSTPSLPPCGRVGEVRASVICPARRRRTIGHAFRSSVFVSSAWWSESTSTCAVSAGRSAGEKTSRIFSAVAAGAFGPPVGLAGSFGGSAVETSASAARTVVTFKMNRSSG